MSVNIPLLRKAVSWAEVEATKPEIDSEWYQSAWVSTPRHRAEMMALDFFYDASRGNKWENQIIEQVAAHCGTAYCIAGYIGQMFDDDFKTGFTNSEGIDVDDFAREKLGLTFNQAEALFAGENTIEDVRRIAEEIAGENL